MQLKRFRVPQETSKFIIMSYHIFIPGFLVLVRFVYFVSQEARYIYKIN